MRRTKIVLIVLLGGIMLSLCVLLGIGISTGRGFWNGFGVHGGSDVGSKDAGSIDVGRIDVGRSVTGDFSVGDMDDADDMDDMHDVDSQGTDKYFTWNRNYSLVLEKEIPAKDIRSLNINYSMTFNDVIFYQGDGENVLVREYMSFEPEERQISTVEQNGTELAVKGARRNSFSFFYVGFRDAYTEIYLPAELTENLEHVSVKTVSGSVLSQIPLAQTGTFQVSTTSGDVFFPEVRAEKIELSSVSGDIRLALTRTDKTELSTTSGDIMLDQASGEAVISSTSGMIRLLALKGGLRVTTTSGDISLGKVKGDMNISTTSGEVRLQEGQGELDASSTSGDIRADSLEGAFRLDTTSGTLSIAKGSGFGKAGSVSGDIRIFLDELQGGLDISTTSGDVSLQLPKTASLSLHFSSTSGECVTFFDEELSFNKKGNKAEGQHGGGEHSIDVSTVSGDLSISEE
nr:DUF4097 family beta strand repeat-containing protein [uncultured Acetatifactor sp.]